MTEETKSDKPVIGEIAHVLAGRDATRGFVGDLALPQDKLLQAKGEDLKLYEYVRSDEQVKTALQQRVGALISKEWEVVPGGDRPIDKEAAEDLAAQLKQIDIEKAVEKMHSGIFFGYAVAEMLWQPEDGRIRISGIKVRDRRRFKFGVDGSLRLSMLGKPQGEIMPPRKFWTFATGADHDDDPYGLGLAHWLYWPVFFKRGGLRAWSLFLDKFGSPTIKGEYEPNTDQAGIDKLLKALDAIRSDGAIAVPRGMAIEILEAARTGTADHAGIFDRMNGAVSKVVLGGTMTTDDGASLAQGQVHLSVRDDIVAADNTVICGSFNVGPARWLTEWNFPGAMPPAFWFKVRGAPDLKAQAERDKAVLDLGYKPSLDYVKQTYGAHWEERAIVQGPDRFDDPGGAAAFAEGKRAADAVDKIGALAAEPAKAAIGDMIGVIEKLLGEVESLDELQDRLLEIYADVDPSALARVIAGAQTLAELQGRHDLAQGG